MAVKISIGKQPTAGDSPHAKQYYCGTCGSIDVVWDAYSEWDVDKQEEVLRTSFDEVICQSASCDGNSTHVETISAYAWRAVGSPDVIVEGMEQCAQGLHSWVNDSGVTEGECTVCGEPYK